MSKISYSNYPMLKKLQEGALGGLMISANDHAFFLERTEAFRDHWDSSLPFFNEEINVISKPFFDATWKAIPKLKEIFTDLAVSGERVDIGGTYIVNNHVYMLNFKIVEGKIKVCFYLFNKDVTPLICYANSSDGTPNVSWVSTIFDVAGDKLGFIFKHLYLTQFFSLFKKYAEVETKILEPHTKVKTPSTKYVNDTKLKLTYLDSKWFTTLVKSDAFKVSGHFRLQPYKETKKLIWISDFVKTGYTAPARKIENNL